MVTQTAAMLMLATCAGVRPRSSRIMGINGATANQAKKQTKNAIQVRWKARMGMVLKVRSRKRVARCSMSGAPCGRDGAMQGECHGRNQGVAGVSLCFCASLVRAHGFRSPKVVRDRGCLILGSCRELRRLLRRSRLGTRRQAPAR